MAKQLKSSISKDDSESEQETLFMAAIEAKMMDLKFAKTVGKLMPTSAKVSSTRSVEVDKNYLASIVGIAKNKDNDSGPD